MSYREVIPDQTLPDIWREITLNTGGTQSTLQDIKVAEKANGYSYRTFDKHHTRNRFIYWRINHDVLELVEQSLDVNLTGNKVKYRFIDTPILDGITIYETFDNVIILVPTVCSVHRLIFPHPDVIYKHADSSTLHPDLTVASIFAETSVINPRDSSIFNVFNNPHTTNSQLPQVATSLLTVHEEAIFLFGYPSGEILLVKQSVNGQCMSVELKYETFMPRFITGLAEKFRSKVNDGNVVVSMLLHTLGSETYAFTLSYDGNLRIWACSKGNCIAATDLISEISCLGQRLTQGSQNHILKKIDRDHESELNIVVFMSFSTECQFHIFKTTINNNQFKILRINTLYSPGKDLVDFNLSSNKIWSMWRSEDGETAVYSTEILSDGGEGSHWIPATLEPIPDANFEPDMNSLDPRQAYLNHIFYPSRFPLAVINKALSVYKRSQVLSEVSLSPSALKQRVCLAVETEMQNELKEVEVSDEDYLERADWCWAKFYSCCVQYHVAGLRPLGLLVLSSSSGVVLLKKSMYSFLRPHDALEHMMMCSDYVTIKHFANNPILSEDLSVAEDVIKLMNVVVYLEQQLSDAFKYTFERELSQLKLPDVIMTDIITEILKETDEQFTWVISQKLSSCKDIYQAMHKLLELLRIETTRASEDDDMGGFKDLNYMFSSRLGVSLVSKCLHQQAVVRFTICRNLLFIQNILIQDGDQKWNALEAVRSVCRIEIVLLIQASYTVLYVSELISLPVLPLESTMARLTSLKLDPVFLIKTNNKQTTTLLDHFITSTGGFEAHQILSQLQYDNDKVVNWNISLLTYVQLVTQQLWPASESSIFAEWLLSSGQHIWLQQYVRLLNHWCEWNNSTRYFLLAVSFLSTGEHKKAHDLFLKAAKGIFTDTFLMKRILSISESDDERRAYVNYYLKVIHLFDLHGARDCALSIATKALGNADPKDPHVATLYSIKFIHHLALQHYDQAYDSINANPEVERKKDNLRDLVKTLFDHKELDKLMIYSYTDLDRHCNTIISDYARASDPLHNLYYDFLYAFYINRGPAFFRSAASIMYEQAYRLKHYNTIDALEKQIKCYLACVNALSSAPPKEHYLIKPNDPDADEEVITLSNIFPMDDPGRVITFNNRVSILEIADIKPELELASARLRLARFYSKNLTDSSITPIEVVGYLCSAGMFKYALLLCKTFKFKYDMVFYTLTKGCIYLNETEDPNSWKWLIENDLHDLNTVGNSPSSVAWNLLQTYLEQYEENNMTTLHKVVCRKIIQMRGFIPQWILTSYKLRNPAELLRLYYFNGRLEEAVEIACEYILAALGHGKEYYGFEYPLSSMSKSICLPIHTIDSLIKELHLQNLESLLKPFEQEYERLNDLFKKYLETVARVTTEKFRLKIAEAEPPSCITVSF